jgi:hypothetical protein
MFVRSASSTLLAVALVAGASGCSKPRTSAATQPTPVAFDPAQSDPKALEVVAAGHSKLGGYENWEKLKELKFSVTYKDADVVKAKFDHAWDRWNGRHHWVTVDMTTTTTGKPEDVKYMEVKHDLFDKDRKPWAAYGGAELPTRADSTEQAKRAGESLKQDLYFLSMIYKLRDPGVKLSVDNAEVTVADSEACKPSCTSIKVSFDPAVGTDTWIVNYNNESKLPEVIEQQRGAGRIGYQIQGWGDAGGLKWPTKLQNLGLKSEIIEFSDIAVGEPDDATYVPTLQ